MGFDTAAQVEIAKLKIALEANSPQLIYSRQDTLALIALLQLASGTGGSVTVSGGGGGASATVVPGTTSVATTDSAVAVAVRPDSSIGVSSLPAAVVADIAAIKANTARLPQYDFKLAEDTSGVVFFVRTDNVTGSASYINLSTGLSYTPIGGVELTDPIATQSAIEINEFEAITANSGNWAIGDILTRVLLVNSATGAIVATAWQSAAGLPLVATPVVGVDAVDGDKQQLAVLRSQLTAINTLLPLGTPVTGETLPSGSGFTGWFSSLRLIVNSVRSALPAALVGGKLAVDASNSTVTANAGTNLNTSALALEAGNLAAILAKLSADPATQITLAAVLAALNTGTTHTDLVAIKSLLPTALVGGRLSIDGSAVTQPISATALPLPAGAATSAAQASILTAVTGVATAVNQTNGAQQSKITDGTNLVAVKGANAAPATTDPALTVVVRPDSTIGVSSLPASVVADIAAIKINTGRISQYGFQLAEDTAGTVFLIKTDTTTGTSVNINVSTGLAFAPVGSIELTDPIASGLSIEVNEFSTLTTNAGNWAIGDILTRVRVVNSSTGLVTVTNWQKSDGTALAIIPVVGTDIEDATKRELTLLQGILNSQSTLASAGFQKITDGTNTATIRAGSSSPALGDTALVVSLSGNSANMGGLVPNTTATRSGTVSGIFNTVLPTLTTGQMVPLQLSANSELIVAPYIGGAPIAGNQGGASAQTLRVVQAQLPTSQAGQINPAADTALAANARIRGLLFTNTSAIPVFLGVYNSAAALTAASVPNVGYVIRVPAGATLDKGVADFGENGRLFGADTRIGLSSTMATFTALTAPNLLLCSLNAETV